MPAQSTIGILGVNSANWIIAWLGIQQAGHVSVGLNYRLPKTQLDHCIQSSNISLVFGDSELATTVSADIPYIQFGEAFDNFLNFESYTFPNLDPDRTVHIFYTSGSLDLPKGVDVKYKDKLINRNTNYKDFSDKLHTSLTASPFYHIAGALALETALYQGCGFFVLPKFEVNAFINTLVKFKIAAISLVPATMAMILSELEKTQHGSILSLFSVRLVAASASESMINKSIQYFPNAKIDSSYGLTELTHTIFGDFHPEGLSVPVGSVGYPAPDTQIKLINNELRVKSSFQGYINTNDNKIDKDGYFITGDIFSVDGNGFYYYVDRVDSMFKSGGEKIYPQQIEKKINQHSSVALSAVIKLPDNIKGHKAYAFVVLKAEYTLNMSSIQDWVAEQLGTHCVPKQIWAIEELPLGSSNKIDYSVLIDLAEKFLCTPDAAININTMNSYLTRLSGKIAVVVGAAGGVGWATCSRLAQQGATVIGLVRKDVDKANNLFLQLPPASLAHRVIQADITDTNQLAHAAEIIKNQFGKCDILINAAGSTQSILHKDLNNLTDEIFAEIVNINLVSIFATIREFSSLLIASNNGLIVNVSSIAGSGTGGSNLAYAAAKAGVESLTRNLSIALAPSIRIVSVAPSYMETGFVPNAASTRAKHELSMTPLGRNATPDDVAAVIESCATTMTFVTGQTIIVDGGRSV